MNGKNWTPEEDAWLREHYFGTEMGEIASYLGRPVEGIYRRAHRLRLSRYSSGARTKVRAGHRPHNLHPIGYECQRSDGYVYVKVRDDGPAEKMMVAKHRLVWERHHGPIPPGAIVQFRDGNRANCDIENLYLISRKELVEANKRDKRHDTGLSQAEYERLLRRALEPFKPIRTMNDVLKREAEIREASIEAYKEEGKRMGPDRRKTETERCGFIPPLNHNVKFDF